MNLVKIIISMENTIKLLVAIGAICSGVGEILKQFNQTEGRIKNDIQKIMSESPKNTDNTENKK
jgi:hypothetical protein